MSVAQSRLLQIRDILTMNRTATTIPFDSNCTKFPSRKDVPKRADAPEGAAWVWGEDDQVHSPKSSYSVSTECNHSLVESIFSPQRGSKRLQLRSRQEKLLLSSKTCWTIPIFQRLGSHQQPTHECPGGPVLPSRNLQTRDQNPVPRKSL